jgi:hypothetical protein
MYCLRDKISSKQVVLLNSVAFKNIMVDVSSQQLSFCICFTGNHIIDAIMTDKAINYSHSLNHQDLKGQPGKIEFCVTFNFGTEERRHKTILERSSTKI